MQQSPLPVSLLLQLGIVVKAELNRSSNDSLCINQTVRLGDNSPVDTPGLALGGCPMIFCGSGYCLNLLGTEPPVQMQFFSNNLSGRKMMLFTAIPQAEVMTGTSDIDHLPVNIVELRQIQTLLNNIPSVVFPMSGIEVSISRNYLILNELN